MSVFLLITLVAGGVFAQSAAGGRVRQVPVSKYDITVNSNVKGAAIYIDNQRQKGTTPATFTLSAGDHLFRVVASGYEEYARQVNISSAITINAYLNPMNVKIAFRSNVANAQVLINGAFKGRTPLDIDLTPGRYALKSTAPGYQDYETTINVSRNDTINIYLQPLTYSLMISSNVPNADVTVNGSMHGNAPFRATVPGGSYTVKITAPGYLDYITTVNVQQDTTVNAFLQPALATVNIDLPSAFTDNRRKDSASMILVYVDGVQQGASAFQVTPGKHSIRFVSGGFATEQDFQFESGQTYTLSPYLEIRIR